MTTLRHLAHAVGSTGAEEPPYRVELSTGGHRLLADEPLAEGGGDLGPSPMSLLVSAPAACTATTLRIYSARKGWDLASISVDVRFNLAESGEDVDPTARSRCLPAFFPINACGSPTSLSGPR